MTDSVVEFVKKFEGFSPVVYLCPAGKPTIGYGHVVREGEIFNEPITEAQAEEMLRNELKEIEAQIKRSLGRIKISEKSMGALISFVHNVGIAAFNRSTLRRKIIEGDLKGAADEFLRWVYAGGKKLKGLELRRRAERELFLEGIDT